MVSFLKLRRQCGVSHEVRQGFIRNAIALFLLGGAGVGLGVAASKGINRLINGNRVNSRSQSRELSRSQERSQSLIQGREETMENIPVEEEEQEEIEMKILPATESSKKSARR